MDRSGALLLTLVSIVTLVTATPHGYGVKGGATAKAEARAVAGAFGDLGPIPLSIPAGSGFSGSFSKSSASSYSSASSSSSSSSYSFSGSSANGIAGIGGHGPLAGNKGCSGDCNGANGPVLTELDSNKNGAQLFSSANAAATAEAKAISGSYTPCQGSECKDSVDTSKKCTSGQCSKESENDCTTGTCQQNSEREAPPSENGFTNDCSSGRCDENKRGDVNSDSDDFAVNINRAYKPQSSLDSSSQNSENSKSYNSASRCSNGECEPSNFQPHRLTKDKNQQSGLPSISEQSGNVRSPGNIDGTPARHLTTPNQNRPPCTSSSCNYSPSDNPSTDGLPSSYNVPINSATNPPETPYSILSGSRYTPERPTQNKNELVGPCTSPNCNSATYGAAPFNIPTYQTNPSDASPGCVSGICDNKNTNHGIASGVSSPSYPQESHGSHVPSNCNTPNCVDVPTNPPNLGSPKETKYPVPTYSNVPANQPAADSSHSNCGVQGCGGVTNPSLNSITNPVSKNTPVYSGGFGGPSGFLDISGTNSLSGSYGTTKPNDFSYAGHYTPTHTLNTVGQTGAHGSTPSHGSFGFTKPSTMLSTPFAHYNPSYTSTFGAPTPSGAPVGSVAPSEANGVYHPNMVTNNGNSLPSSAYAGSNQGSAAESHTGSSSTHGSFGFTKPSTVLTAPSEQQKPTYTDTYGVPTTSSGAPSGSVAQSGVNGVFKPHTGTTYDNSLHSPTYSSSTGTNGSPNIPHVSYGISKPNTAINSKGDQHYTGGFGGPTSTMWDSRPSSEGSSSTKPSSTNCGSAGCNGKPGTTNTNGGYDLHDTSKPSTTSGQNKPAYSGGFGGPTGILKPNDFSISADSLSSSTGSTSCASGKCEPNSDQSGTHNLGGTSTDTHSLASSSASAKAVAYSGGFGGPPGFLKPSDDGKVNAAPHGHLGNSHSANSQDTLGHGPDSTPSTKSKGSTGGGSVDAANSGAFATASATANAGSYPATNGNQHHSGCHSGCGSNTDPHSSHSDGQGLVNGEGLGSVASAKSVAGARSFGHGGSFASSSASAHASAGAATKGGYGKK